MRGRRRRLVSALAALAFSSFGLAPKLAAADGPRPAPPRCDPAPAMTPGATHLYARMGGAAVIGCFVQGQGVVYTFTRGQILIAPAYGDGFAVASVLDRKDSIHLWWGDGGDAGRWLVRFTYRGSLVNQVAYDAQSGNVGTNSGTDVIVHPAGRRGTMELAIEGCDHNLIVGYGCLGWIPFTVTI